MKLKLNLNLCVSIIALAGMMLANTGCSNENNLEPNSDETITMSKTLQELADFNSTLELESTTRGTVNEDLKNKLMVVLSDSKGAYEGAKLGLKTADQIEDCSAAAGMSVGGSVVGSAESWDAYNLKTIPMSYSGSDELESQGNNTTESSGDIEMDDIYFAAAYAYSKQNVLEADYRLGTNLGIGSKDCIRVGILHNHILRFLSMLSSGFDPKPWWLMLSPEEKAIYNSDYFRKGWNKIRYPQGSPTFSVLTESDKIMNMYLEAVSTSGTNQVEVERISKEYALIIKNSGSLSQEDKVALWAGICVMTYSYDYWKNRLNLK